jgi:ribonuclease BN (tRNA processing enzyme)
VRLTTIGTGTIALSAARSCSSYLVEHGDTRLLMDCGSGTTRRLAELGIAWAAITDVALTHFHIDHHGDLPTLIFAMKYGMLPPRAAPLRIIGPPGTASLVDRLAAAYGAWVAAPGFTLTIQEIEPGGRIALADGAVIEAHKVPHTEESVAYSVEAEARRIVYSGDTGVSTELADWAAGCDVLVLECSLPDAMAIPEHLTPAQCGTLAARARPGRLVLTHLYPPVELVDIESEVRRAFDGRVTIAADGMRIEI